MLIRLGARAASVGVQRNACRSRALRVQASRHQHIRSSLHRRRNFPSHHAALVLTACLASSASMASIVAQAQESKQPAGACRRAEGLRRAGSACRCQSSASCCLPTPSSPSCAWSRPLTHGRCCVFPRRYCPPAALRRLFVTLGLTSRMCQSTPATLR